MVLVIGCMLAPYGVVAEALDSETTQIVMLGTGTPNPFPDRSGPSVAIVVNDEPKLLILYHQLLWGSTHETLIDEVKTEFSGTVVSARDLDIF